MEKRKLFKSIISWLIYLAVLVGLVYGIPQGLSYVLKTPHPMASITSGSMWPALQKGDLVLIKAVDKEELEIGDIVVYQNIMSFTVHRVIKLNETTLVTKGDANNVQDSPVEYDQLVGRVVEFRDKPLRIPYFGMISVLISKYRS